MINQATPYTSFPTAGKYMFKEHPEPVSKIAHLLSDDMELYTGNNHQLRSIQRNHGNFLRYTGISGIDEDPELFLGKLGNWIKEKAVPNIKKAFTTAVGVVGGASGVDTSGITGGSSGGNSGGMTANDILLLNQQQEQARRAEQEARDAKTQQTLIYAGVGVFVLIIISVIALKFAK